MQLYAPGQVLMQHGYGCDISNSIYDASRNVLFTKWCDMLEQDSVEILKTFGMIDHKASMVWENWVNFQVL